MQHEFRLASFNVYNLALSGVVYYDTLPPYTQQEYDKKINWIAQQIDQSNADVIGFQEIFSQDALRDVLSRTQHYRSAHHIGFDPNMQSSLTPSVALVSRLPLAGNGQLHKMLPEQIQVTLPNDHLPITHFSRPVLEVPVLLPDQTIVSVLVVHLKSRKPAFVVNADKTNSFQFGLATLRAMVRRGAEALGVRCLVNDLFEKTTSPVIVMGDFNDIPLSVSTQLITGVPQEHEQVSHPYLYDCFDIQSNYPSENFQTNTFIDGTSFTRIDHILVSKEFTKRTDFLLGEVKQVTFFHEHLGLKAPLIKSVSEMKSEAHRAQETRHIIEIGEFSSTEQRCYSLAQPLNQRCLNLRETSDHCLVLARIQLRHKS